MAKANETIIVRNFTDSQVTIPLPYTKDATGRAAASGEVILMPGVNEVDAAKWDKAATSPAVKAYLKMRAKGGITVDEKSSGPADLSVDDAVDLVEDTVDGALLKKWAEREDRAEVSAAIKSQIEKIDPRNDKATGDFESAS